MRFLVLLLVLLARVQAAPVQPLDSEQDLRQAFESLKGHPRLILFVSPGCKGCFWATRFVERNALTEHPERDLRLMIVWVPVFPLDDETRANNAAIQSQDPRVSAYYDRHATASRWFYQHVIKDWPGLNEKPAFRREKAWDSFFLYGADATWEDLNKGLGGATIQLERQKLLDGLAELYR